MQILSNVLNAMRGLRPTNSVAPTEGEALDNTEVNEDTFEPTQPATTQAQEVVATRAAPGAPGQAPQQPCPQKAIPSRPEQTGAPALALSQARTTQTIHALQSPHAKVRVDELINGVALFSKHAQQDWDVAARTELFVHLREIWQDRRVAIIAVRHDDGEVHLRRTLARAAIDPAHDFLLFVEGYASEGTEENILLDHGHILDAEPARIRTNALRANISGLEVDPVSPAALLVRIYREFYEDQSPADLVFRIRRLCDDFDTARATFQKMLSSQTSMMKHISACIVRGKELRDADVDTNMFSSFLHDYVDRFGMSLKKFKPLRQGYYRALSECRKGMSAQASPNFLLDQCFNICVCERNKAWLQHIQRVLDSRNDAHKKIVIVCGIGHVDDLLPRLVPLETAAIQRQSARPPGSAKPARSRKR